MIGSVLCTLEGFYAQVMALYMSIIMFFHPTSFSPLTFLHFLTTTSGFNCSTSFSLAYQSWYRKSIGQTRAIQQNKIEVEMDNTTITPAGDSKVGTKRSEAEMAAASMDQHVADHIGESSTALEGMDEHDDGGGLPVVKKTKKSGKTPIENEPALVRTSDAANEADNGQAVLNANATNEGGSLISERTVNTNEPVSTNDGTVETVPAIEQEEVEEISLSETGQESMSAVEEELEGEAEAVIEQEGLVHAITSQEAETTGREEATGQDTPAATQEGLPHINTTSSETTSSLPEEHTVENEPATHSDPGHVDTEAASIGQEHSHTSEGPLRRRGGVYDIVCREFNAGPLSLRVKGQSVWGAFEFEQWEGCLWIRECPEESSEEKLHVVWRARDDQTGELEAGDGYISFLRGRRIVGNLISEGVEDHVSDLNIHFSGTKDTTGTLPWATGIKKKFEALGREMNAGEALAYGEEEDLAYVGDLADEW